MDIAFPSHVDLLIIGGGITGAGIARDAALRGYRVALCEKHDYAAGTSSKSSKLVHGGLRYLEQGELRLVFESVSERRVQMHVAPHLVKPLPFLVPVFRDTKPGLEVMNLGLWIYDGLAMFRAPALHRTFRGARAALALEPKLRAADLTGAIEYYDCATDDARLVIENIVDATALGATCRNYTEVVQLTRLEQGGHRATIKCHRTGTQHTVEAGAVIVAAGPWTDEMLARWGMSVAARPKVLRRTKGVHMVVPAERLPLARAITLISPVDKRVMFAIPWRDRTVIGTTDTDFDGRADEVYATAADIAYLCESANGYFPAAQLGPADVISTWAGLRPLVAQGDATDESEVSREHEILRTTDGVTLIAGGKLTTYRLMAKQALLAIADLLPPAPHRRDTKTRPLPGAQGLASATLEGVASVGRSLIAEYGLAADVATHLCGVYGERAHTLVAASAPQDRLRIEAELPYIWAEIDFAIRHDHALTVCDVLVRRLSLLLVSRDQGLGILPQVIARMATLLQWDAAEQAQQAAAYEREVALSRRWQAA